LKTTLNKVLMGASRRLFGGLLTLALAKFRNHQSLRKVVMNELKGKKIGMSQVFNKDDHVVPVTLVKLDAWSEALKPGVLVTVTGTAKGKGFAGVIKRWGFKGLPATHGHPHQRKAGSIGGTTTPGRVYKGKKMAGRMGRQKVTERGHEVVELDEAEKIVKISGALPGPPKSVVVLKL
jgi:ribosomal protein L3